MSPAEQDGAIARMLILKALPLFTDAQPDELAVVAEHTTMRTFRAGERLIGGSAAVGDIHLVLDGRVTEHRGGRPFRVYGPQRVLGGIDALALGDADVEAVADEDTRTLSIARTALRDILADNFGILMVALQGVAASTLRLRRGLSASGDETTARLPADAPPADGLAARLRFLHDTTWLRALTVRTLGQLARDAEVEEHDDGATVWTAGATTERIAVVQHGTIACTVPGGTRRFTVGRGVVLGLEEALAMEPWHHDGTARGPVRLLTLHRADLIDTLEDDPDAAIVLLSGMASIAAGLRDRMAAGDDRVGTHRDGVAAGEVRA